MYQLRGADGRDWAVKCFTRPVAGLADRYAAVRDAPGAGRTCRSPSGSRSWPRASGSRGSGGRCVKMEWVDGLLLNQFVRENADRPDLLDALVALWVQLCRRLREAGIAHADLQHGNVLLVPGRSRARWR